MAWRGSKHHGGRRGSGGLERVSSTSTARLQLRSMSTYQRWVSMPRRTPILPNPRTLLRASVFLCKWQLKAPRHGGRGGGRIKAQAARLPWCGGGGGCRTREARSGATARPRARSRSRVAVEALTAARSCSRRSVGSLGGGCGHGHPLHSCPPWAARAAWTRFRLSERLSARAHASPRELREQLSAQKKGKANVEHALIRDWNDKIVLGMS